MIKLARNLSNILFLKHFLSLFFLLKNLEKNSICLLIFNEFFFVLIQSTILLFIIIIIPSVLCPHWYLFIMSILTFKIYNLGIATCILNFPQYTYYEYGSTSSTIYKLGTLGLYFSCFLLSRICIMCSVYMYYNYKHHNFCFLCGLYIVIWKEWRILKYCFKYIQIFCCGIWFHVVA